MPNPLGIPRNIASVAGLSPRLARLASLIASRPLAVRITPGAEIGGVRPVTLTVHDVDGARVPVRHLIAVHVVATGGTLDIGSVTTGVLVAIDSAADPLWAFIATNTSGVAVVDINGTSGALGDIRVYVIGESDDANLTFA